MTPSRLALRAVWAFHRGLRRITRGRLGTTTPRRDRVGTLFLHTVGRKSRQPRVNGLFYLQDGPDLVVVASNAGAATDPAWWLNLRAAFEGEVEIVGKRRPVRARPASAEEAPRLWPRLDAGYPGYATYRSAAGRPIQVVILEPA